MVYDKRRGWAPLLKVVSYCNFVSNIFHRDPLSPIGDLHD